MKAINAYINEKFQVSKDNIRPYNYYPKTKEELRKILEERLTKDENANLNDIDVSEITDMSYLFFKLHPHNIDISEWDVSNVEDMHDMFYGCNDFNADLSSWDVSNVKRMDGMFYLCEKFNSNLSEWDVSKVENMSFMFYYCTNFNADLSKWNVSNVKAKDMTWAFYGCYTLKKLKNIPAWYKGS